MKRYSNFITIFLLLFSGVANAFTIEYAMTTEDIPLSNCSRPFSQSNFSEDSSDIYAWIDFRDYIAGDTYRYVWRNSLDDNIKTKEYPPRTYNSNGCSFTPFDIDLIKKNQDNLVYVDFFYNDDENPRVTMPVEINFDGQFDISKLDIPDFDQSILADEILYPDYFLTPYYCGPAAASNWLKHFDENGYNLVGSDVSSSSSKERQYSIIETLGEDSYMETLSAGKNGTATRAFIKGIDQYVTSRGHKIKNLEYYGWRLVGNQTYRRVGKIADPNVIRDKFGENTAIWLLVGWYNQDDTSNTYDRVSGHYVTVAGFGHDDTQSNRNYLVLHDSSSRSKDTLNEYVEFQQLPADAAITINGKSTGNEFTAHNPALSFSDFYQLTGDIAINTNKGADTTIIDAIVIMELDDKNEAPEADVSIDISDVTDTNDEIGYLQKFKIYISNSGPDTAVNTEVQLNTNLSSDLAIIFSEDDKKVRCETLEYSSVCNVPRIDSGTVLSLDAYVIPSNSGTLMLNASASTFNPDPNISNNQIDLTKTIDEKPYCKQFTNTISEHETNNRVYSETSAGWLWFPGTTTYYAMGSQENLGTNKNSTVTLKEQPQGYLSKGTCDDGALPSIFSITVSTSANGATISGEAFDKNNSIEAIHLFAKNEEGFLVHKECDGTTNWVCELINLPNGNYSSTIFAVDRAGLTSEVDDYAKVDFLIDGSEQHIPEIDSHELTITDNSVVITGTASDLDSDLSEVLYNLKNSENQKSCNLNLGEYSCTITTLASGTYYIELHAIDEKGNVSSTYGPIEAAINNEEKECHTAMTFQHINAGRAYICDSEWPPKGCANGSGDYLGTAFIGNSLMKQSPDYWVKVGSCP